MRTYKCLTCGETSHSAALWSKCKGGGKLVEQHPLDVPFGDCDWCDPEPCARKVGKERKGIKLEGVKE